MSRMKLSAPGLRRERKEKPARNALHSDAGGSGINLPVGRQGNKRALMSIGALLFDVRIIEP